MRSPNEHSFLFSFYFLNVEYISACFGANVHVRDARSVTDLCQLPESLANCTSC